MSAGSPSIFVYCEILFQNVVPLMKDFVSLIVLMRFLVSLFFRRIFKRLSKNSFYMILCTIVPSIEAEYCPFCSHNWGDRDMELMQDPSDERHKKKKNYGRMENVPPNSILAEYGFRFLYFKLEYLYSSHNHFIGSSQFSILFRSFFQNVWLKYYLTVYFEHYPGILISRFRPRFDRG